MFQTQLKLTRVNVSQGFLTLQLRRSQLHWASATDAYMCLTKLSIPIHRKATQKQVQADPRLARVECAAVCGNVPLGVSADTLAGCILTVRGLSTQQSWALLENTQVEDKISGFNVFQNALKKKKVLIVGAFSAFSYHTTSPLYSLIFFEKLL